MKFLIAAVVAALALFTIPTTAMVNAQEPDGCFFGNSPSTYQKQQGIAKCLSADLTAEEVALGYQGFDTRLAEYVACLERVEEITAGKRVASPAWWHFSEFFDASLYCDESGLAGPGGVSICNDWQTAGPGTGHGVNPAASAANCAAWLKAAFSPYLVAPVVIGEAVRCPPTEACQQSGDSNPANARAPTVAAEAVSFSPPSAGSGGLLGHGTSVDVGVFAVLGVLIVAAQAATLALYGRISRW